MYTHRHIQGHDYRIRLGRAGKKSVTQLYLTVDAAAVSLTVTSRQVLPGSSSGFCLQLLVGCLALRLTAVAVTG